MASVFIFLGRLWRKKKEGKSRRGYYCEEVAAWPPDPKKKNTAGRKEAAIARGGGCHSWRAEQKNEDGPGRRGPVNGLRPQGVDSCQI